MKKVFCIATALLVVFASCKKDKDDVVKPAEASAISKTFFQTIPVTIAATGSGTFEYGFKFVVTQNGKIAQLGSRMPDAGAYRVTVWDASVTPKVILGSANITQPAGAITYQPITPISLTAGKDYFISVWSSGRWYEIRPATAATFAYPITLGSVSIKGYQWIGSPVVPQGFPSNAETSYVAGVPDFEFQPD
ncbi:MAG TPA: hypothetical protein VK484_05955 [Ferruginibacter sp.]|nr:hypothetical protein [Ferruginibacter sp.]